MMTSIRQWMQTPANRTKKNIILAAGLVIALLLFWYGINRVANFLHDVNYKYQQNKDREAANKSEANASQHEINANVAANNQKELEKDEQTIQRQRADQQKVLDADKRQSKDTRDAYNRARTKVPANRNGDDGIDDDRLRSDSNRAAAAFNGQ